MDVLDEVGEGEVRVKRVMRIRDCHGFVNPHGFWVGYAGGRVRVGFCQPSLNPYPQGGFTGNPWVFYLDRSPARTP